ncbi:hypothetical protein HID58_022357 [Brassica napus]|uniref:PGG domain-containing protein n=1 Tax=Brassica napus TaxID=3708 RepID=A0ABQ8CZ29_BRANA|nr:hypothetical protein HID58_022357 [Brassica napus]
MNAFQHKDQLLSDFYSSGYFPNGRTEKEFNTLKHLINCLAVIVFTVICTYLTFFASMDGRQIKATSIFVQASNFKLRVLRGSRRCVFRQPRRSSSRLPHPVPDHQDGGVSCPSSSKWYISLAVRLDLWCGRSPGEHHRSGGPSVKVSASC